VANALLKTLEEPPPDTYFLLACGDRGALLPTIVSRCTQLPLFPMGAAALRAVAESRATAWDMPAVPELLLPFAEGAPGILLSLHRDGGGALISEAGRFFSAALDPGADAAHGLAFADYLESSPAFEDLASASRLLSFLLRALRLALGLRAGQGFPDRARAETDGAWTRSALSAQGFEPSLSEILAPLEAASDLRALAAWIEELLAAVRDYAKPRHAAFGLYLEYLQKGAPAPALGPVP
jgi:hypothetical protein